jgi:FkbH-like protein/FkbM family methyltransferase
MQNASTFLKDLPTESISEIKVGVGTFPYLSDHGFQDLVVLPGAFYIDSALRLHSESSKFTPGLVQNVVFRNPVILSVEDTVIRIRAKDLGDGRVEYTFYEASAEESGARNAEQQYAARLEICRVNTEPSGGTAESPSIEAFQARADSTLGSEQFYKSLRDNGNQYGPQFQKVSAIWRAGDRSLGKLAVARGPAEHDEHYVHPSLLDAITQLLAPFVMERRRTYILRSIEKIELADLDFPDFLWGFATLLSDGVDAKDGVRANVRVFDSSGKLRMSLSGVALTLLDPTEEKPLAKLKVASNFTAEPLDDTLNFWGDHFGIRFDTEFAPYNQVFQQLLDPGSVFRRNGDGTNVVLLALEDWATGEAGAHMTLDRERAQRVFGDRLRFVLPNGLEIVHLNQYETEYVYKEIFEDQCYLRHGIALQDGDTVIDIGANIGLFSLFVMSRCKNPTIYACEPAPVAYDVLKANCEAYGSNVRALNVGVSDKRKTAAFTYYEKSSVFSGFHSDETEDREAIQAIVRNMLKESTEGDSVEEYVNELTADRLRRKTYECQLVSVSDIIREQRIERIDLLKVDAEKSELDIIKGIADADWPKIRQIVLEIHDPTRETINQVQQLLTEKGFRCALEQETLLQRSGLFNLYAVRTGASGEIRPVTGPVQAVAAGAGRASFQVESLRRNIGDFCSALRSFAVQVPVPLVLCICPRSPAARADAAATVALDEAEQRLFAIAESLPNVHAISSEALLKRYPVENYFDPHSHQAGHVPYTPEGYAAIGTAVVRTAFSLKRNPYKVVALDCDNTLWKGVCGEDGPLGVEVSGPYRRLQEFMIGQMNSGMLLCLCSKNNEKDALEVFETRTDMPIKRENLVAWRLNWSSKSENIRSLAEELNLGLDSFIFIDDNPVECADVRINCPGVLTLQLPRDAEAFEPFLEHIWAFDHVNITEEDRNRTKMYRESSERRQYREQSISLKDFINGLQIRLDIAEATESQVGRISQLTFRTNQFNFTTVRRSENEIGEFLGRDDAKCLTVRVADRFGDYGLVGALMYEIKDDRFKVDTLLMSCRVLGRGVEHALVARLGRRAVEEGKKFVEFTCLPTEKNLPAREFIASIGNQYRDESGTVWVFPAERLAEVEYDPDNNPTVWDDEATGGSKEKPPGRRLAAFGAGGGVDRLQRIGDELYDVARLASAIEKCRLKGESGSAEPETAVGSTLELALLNVWRKVLGRPRIGLNDNFFEVGGTSLKAVQVVATIKRELHQTLSIVNLFECPTVKLLAAKLGGTATPVNEESTPSAAVSRGQHRRIVTTKRKTS